MDDGTTSTFGGVISGAKGVMVLATSGVTNGTMVFTGDNTYTGDTIICDCTTLQLGDGGTTGSILGNVAIGGTLVFNRSNTYDFTGDLTDDGGFAGKVVQAGPGITILSGNNSYSGGTTITAGTLRVMSNNSVGTGPVTLNGGTFQAGTDKLDFANLFAINTVGGIFDTNGSPTATAPAAPSPRSVPARSSSPATTTATAARPTSSPARCALTASLRCRRRPT